MNIFTFIKSRVSIMDVVSHYVSLKKTGMYWKGRCPFHNEKTGSFAISPHRDIFYCFGCHKGGDAIAFVAEIEHCSQLEAARYIAERFALELPQEVLALETVDHTLAALQKYTQLCAVVAEWCHEQLNTYQSAHAYTKTRGLHDATLKLFQVGYFPETGLSGLLEHVKKHNFLAQDLIQAHIIQEGKFGLYSPFSDRIIFPIRDHLGRVCGFGGRVFKPEDTRAKYYNSQDHTFFAKGHVLYGLHCAKKAIQERGTVFLVEGYLDCLAMVQAGYSNTVAILGTACTADHLKLVARYATHMHLLYDGDTAGRQAILKLTHLAWTIYSDIFVIELPSGEDPASFLEKNGDLTALIPQAQDIFSFFLQSMGTEYATKPLQEKVQAIQSCIIAISTLNDSIKQNVLLEKAAALFAIPREVLLEKMHSIGRHAPSLAAALKIAPALEKHALDEATAWECWFFAQLVANRSILEGVSADDKELIKRHMTPALLKLVQAFLLFVAANKTEKNAHSFIDTVSLEDQKRISCILMKGEESTSYTSLAQVLLLLWKKEWKMVLSDVKIRLKHAEAAKDQAAIQEITAQFIELKNKMREKGIL